MANTYVAEEKARGNVQFIDPPFIQSLFGNSAWAWLWLIARLYVGYEWITASLDKLGSPAWMVTGAALKGFWTNAINQGAGTAHPAIAFGWYRSFLQALLDSGAYVWFAKLVAISEIVVGVLLVVGAFTGLAAFIGGFMNWNFMMAGSASINPVLFTVSILLLLAWKIAGWWGLDRFLLPALGTPWRRGTLFGGDQPVAEPEAEPARVESES
jgi:thiosulfate dehydrogenase [quinone] large subunit